MRQSLLWLSSLGLVAGCALRGDVRKVELQVESLKAELAQREAVLQTERDSLARILGTLQQALAAQQTYLVQLRGDLRTDLLAVQQQLVAIQELTGQTQQRLSEQRRRLDDLAQRPVPGIDAAGAAGGLPVGPSGQAAGPGPEQMFDLSFQQYRRGSLATARTGFEEFLRVYPNHARAGEALFYIGETLVPERPDSAAAVYERVVQQHRDSPRAPSALYKLGLLAEQRGDRQAARTYYARVVAGYPRSDEANLARDKLQRLGR